MAQSFKTHAGRARSAQMTAGEMEGSGSADLSLAPAPRSIVSDTWRPCSKLALLDAAQDAWLAHALSMVHPKHPWLTGL